MDGRTDGRMDGAVHGVGESVCSQGAGEVRVSATVGVSLSCLARRRDTYPSYATLGQPSFAANEFTRRASEMG